MGSIVEFNCQGCGFTTGDLRVGWGRAGRTRFWGGLGTCAACKRLSVVDLAAKLDTHRCQECQGQLQLLEGMAQDIPCPECSRVLRTTNEILTLKPTERLHCFLLIEKKCLGRISKIASVFFYEFNYFI